MLNAENLTAFKPGHFLFDNVRQVTGATTLVRMTSRPSSADGDITPSPGSFDFEFQRLYVGSHLAGALTNFRPELPTSTRALLDEITARTGQIFYPGEFEEHYIDRDNSNPYRLIPKASSLRWWGEMAVPLGGQLDLSVYLSDATDDLFIQIPETCNLCTQPLGFSQINATAYAAEIPALPVGVLAQNNSAIAAFVNKVIPAAPSYTASGTTVWNTSAAPGPYNLRNARIVALDREVGVAEHGNPLNPNLTRAVVLELDLAFCTNFTVSTVYIPYQPSYAADTNFTDMPRLRQSGAVSISDGSAHSVFLNSLVAPSILTAVPAGGLQLSGPEMWTADPSTPSRTSLNNAVVQYNGQVRSIDPRPARSGLNRVVVMTMNEPDNLSYRGNILFYYRAPIYINDSIPRGQVGLPFNHSFDLDGLGGPYTIEVTDGNVPPGLTLSLDGLTGTPTVSGIYPVSVRLTDANNVQVDYNLRIIVSG